MNFIFLPFCYNCGSDSKHPIGTGAAPLHSDLYVIVYYPLNVLIVVHL